MSRSSYVEPTALGLVLAALPVMYMICDPFLPCWAGLEKHGTVKGRACTE